MSGAGLSRQVRVSFGHSGTRLVTDSRGVEGQLAMPQVAGPREELIVEVPDAAVEIPQAGCALVRGADCLAGVMVWPRSGPLDELSASLYRELLRHARGWHITRIWNYVPEINSETTGLENYRRFNLGRWQAYHEAYGNALSSNLPAASAVGVRGDFLVAVFVATRGPVERVENPHQVPAWKYPAAHGPKAPSFVRATRADACGQRWCWVSGTASIRGHESVAPGDLTTQLKVTRENLDVVLGSLGLPLMGEAPTGGTRVLTKVYLRDGGKLDVVRDGLGAAAAGALFVEADICRAELELEIEVSVVTDCLFPASASR